MSLADHCRRGRPHGQVVGVIDVAKVEGITKFAINVERSEALPRWQTLAFSSSEPASCCMASLRSPSVRSTSGELRRDGHRDDGVPGQAQEDAASSAGRDRAGAAQARAAPRELCGCSRASRDPPPEAQANPTVDAVPDFGLSLTGGVEGTGLALPAGGGVRSATRSLSSRRALRRRSLQRRRRQLRTSAPSRPPSPRCARSPNRRTPTRPRAPPGFEGKVRVEITVDETGRVVDVKLVQGLSPGLDAAALAAGRAARVRACRSLRQARARHFQDRYSLRD